MFTIFFCAKLHIVNFALKLHKLLTVIIVELTEIIVELTTIVVELTVIIIEVTVLKRA